MSLCPFDAEDGKQQAPSNNNTVSVDTRRVAQVWQVARVEETHAARSGMQSAAAIPLWCNDVALYNEGIGRKALGCAGSMTSRVERSRRTGRSARRVARTEQSSREYARRPIPSTGSFSRSLVHCRSSPPPHQPDSTSTRSSSNAAIHEGTTQCSVCVPARPCQRHERGRHAHRNKRRGRRSLSLSAV